MWIYKDISRAEFEKRKDYVEQLMRGLGCVSVEIEPPYVQNTTSICGKNEEIWRFKRPIYKFKGGFYRIDEVLFSKKPFIVLEYAETWEDVQRNVMEDCEPFPYDLSDEETVNEVRYSLGIEPYPQDK